MYDKTGVFECYSSAHEARRAKRLRGLGYLDADFGVIRGLLRQHVPSTARRDRQAFRVPVAHDAEVIVERFSDPLRFEAESSESVSRS